MLTSECFSRCKEKIAQFDEYVASKLIAVQGDLVAPRLGIENSVYEEMTQRLEVIINVAATVDFTE